MIPASPSRCHGNQAAFSAVEIPPASATAAVSQPNVLQVPGTTAEAGRAAAAEDPNQAELNAEDIHAQKLVPDPWESFNRKMHGFNNAADKFVLRPLAVGYKKVTPVPVQAGVSRFFANLSMPVTVVNQALQGGGLAMR